jgi:hypothetical protein
MHLVLSKVQGRIVVTHREKESLMIDQSCRPPVQLTTSFDVLHCIQIQRYLIPPRLLSSVIARV